MAAIGLASGNTCASWRTRHLRIRASILKEALDADCEAPGGVWCLLHLKGTELVADGLTKQLLGQAFTKFVEDLGLKKTATAVEPCGPSSTTAATISSASSLSATAEMNPATATGGGSNGGFAAVKALILGSMMLSSSVEGATEEEDDQSDYTPAMVVGAILLALGAIQVGQVVHSAASYCLRRLKGPEDQSDLRQRRRESDGISSEEDDSILVVSEDEIATSSHQKRSRSGGTSSRKSSKRSGCGSAVRTTSQKITSRSGFEHCDEGASSLSLRRQSGLQRQHDLAADAAGSNDLSSGRSGPGDPAAAERSRSSSTTSGLASMSDSAAQKEPSNPWNHFQHALAAGITENRSLWELHLDTLHRYTPGGQALEEAEKMKIERGEDFGICCANSVTFLERSDCTEKIGSDLRAVEGLAMLNPPMAWSWHSSLAEVEKSLQR
eukprot:s1434_g20.t1